MGGGMSVGDVGEQAVVLQGQNLTLLNVTVDLESLDDVSAAQRFIDRIRAGAGERPAYGSPLRRLEPLVLVNRKRELDELVHALQDRVPVVVVEGVPGVGKSSLARAALELRAPDVPVAWLAAESATVLDVAEALDAAGHLGIPSRPEALPLAAAVLAAARTPVLLVLDGVEALLDDATSYFRSRDFSRFFELVTTAEHPVGFLLTTRRRPADLEGVDGVRTVKLTGLAPAQAEDLLRDRASDAAKVGQVLESRLLDRLSGNPKLITLLAASLGELPVSLVAGNLREASDIGAYVTREVISHLTPAERDLVVTASLMPSTFRLDDLVELHGVRCGDPSSAIPAVKALLRRALLEKTEEGDYFVHALVSENAHPDPASAAEAHAVAAGWFEGKATPADVGPLAWALTHLQAALDAGWSPERSRQAADFLTAHQRDLGFAGHGRALLRLADSILAHEDAPEIAFSMRFLRGSELWQLGEYHAALVDFRELWELVQHWEAGADRDHLLVLIGAKLGDTLLNTGDADGATAILRQIEPLAAEETELQAALRVTELSFELARTQRDGAAMLSWARAQFELAHAWDDEKGSTAQTRDAVAEAHFALATAYLTSGSGIFPIVRNFRAQLRIKLDIGKLRGVASGLYNIGVLVRGSDGDVGALMLGTAADLRASIGEKEMYDDVNAARYRDELCRLGADPDRLEAALQRLSRIDERLPAYARRVVAELTSGSDQ